MQKSSFIRAFVMDTEKCKQNSLSHTHKINENKKEKKWNKFSLHVYEMWTTSGVSIDLHNFFFVDEIFFMTQPFDVIRTHSFRIWANLSIGICIYGRA